MNHATSIFRVGLLDDLHTYFPDLLYNSGRFQTVQDVLKYIQDQARRLNPFDRGQELYNTHYRHTDPPVPPPVNEVVTPIPVEDNRRRTDISGNNIARNTPINNISNIQNIQTILQPSTEQIATPVRPRVYTQFPPRILRRPVQYTFSDELFGADDSLSGLASLFNIALNQPFTDVLVTPTAAQINNATSVITATSNEECAICQENMVADASLRRINSCRHTFHQPCIDTWFQSSVTCPICRIDIRE